MCSIAQQLKDCIDDLDNIEILYEKEDYLIIEDNIINKKMKLTGHYLKDYNVEIDNSKIVKFKDYGFKFGNYIEVLIEYYSVLDYDTDSAILTDFAIGDVIVSISKPSDLFSVVMRELESDKYYDKDIMWTISLKGITNENYEKYLTQAIFLFEYYNASTCSNDYPHTYEFLGEEYYRYAMDEDELINRRKRNKEFEELEFSLCRYPEALSFYNAGMEISSYEISFQYFYKVLEHFFLITRQDEFINFISNYNMNHDINIFIDRVTNIYRQNEDIQLLTLLKSNEVSVTPIINESYNQEIIDEATVEKFSNSLYLYRNRIVHGKNDEKFRIKVPNILISKEERFWNDNIRKISEILIEKHCISIRDSSDEI